MSAEGVGATLRGGSLVEPALGAAEYQADGEHDDAREGHLGD
jgi:hypothetical protein